MYQISHDNLNLQTEQTAALVLQYYGMPENESKVIKCDTFVLEKESSAEFKLSGQVHFKDLKKKAEVRDTNTNTQKYKQGLEISFKKKVESPKKTYAKRIVS